MNEAYRINARMAQNTLIAENTFRMELEAGKEAARVFVPGQFAHIRLPGAEDKLLRRPISIALADREKGVFTLIYTVSGAGTELLSRTEAGAVIDMLAPLGNGFSLKPAYKRLWLVGGGVGVAPLLGAAQRFGEECEISAFLGFGAAKMAFGADVLAKYGARVYLATDDGSAGEKGFVTGLLRARMAAEKPDAVFACGPKPMFAALRRAMEGSDIPVMASLEQHMGCGTGGCYTCTCLVAGSMKRVCADGPVFDLAEVAL